MKKRRKLKFGLIFLLCIFLLQGVYYTILDINEDRYFSKNYISKINAKSDEEILLAFLQLSFNLPSHKIRGNPTNYKIVNPLQKILGPSAKQIIENGGHCGRRSRLLINLLKYKNIKARKVHLINKMYEKYNHRHEYVHAVVEVFIDKKWAVADPLYNLVYYNKNGKIAGLKEIQSDLSTFRDGIDRADTKYVDYFEELYTYHEFRKFGWNSLPVGNVAYEFLSKIFGKERMNMVSTPYFLEDPNLCLSAIYYSISLIIILFSFFIVRKK